MAFRHLQTSHRHHQSRILICSEGRLRVLRTFRVLKSDFTQVVYFCSETQKWSSLIVLRAFLLLKKSLLRIRQRVFWMPRIRKCVRMAFRHQETSLHRHHQRRILRRSKGRLWVLRSIRVLKTLLKRHHERRFFRYSEWRKCVRMAFRHL
jgi:hypothetical protein